MSPRTPAVRRPCRPQSSSIVAAPVRRAATGRLFEVEQRCGRGSEDGGFEPEHWAQEVGAQLVVGTKAVAGSYGASAC